MKNGLSQKDIKEGINKAITEVETIAETLWEEHYPNINNGNLERVFVMGFFLEVMNEFKKRYEK